MFLGCFFFIFSFLQNLGKDFIRTNMHTTVVGNFNIANGAQCNSHAHGLNLFSRNNTIKNKMNEIISLVNCANFVVVYYYSIAAHSNQFVQNICDLDISSK